MPTRDEITRWARDLYAKSVDKKDAAGFAAVFTKDAWLRFGNNERLVGPEAIREAIAGFFTAFKTLRHQEKGIFVDGDTVVIEAEVTYVRHDDKSVTVPAVTIYHLAAKDQSRIVADQCRICVDLTPLFAPSA